MSVLIVGGGIAGLATAFELHRRGVPFQLLEARARAGGVILSEEVDGYTLDAGPDALLVQKPEGIKLCEELGLGERLVPTKPPRLAFIQRAGVLHPLPASSVLGIPTRIGPFVRTRLFSWPGKLRMGAEAFVPPRRDGDDESIGSFMTRRFGREATTFLAEPLLAGIHAGDVNRLSVHALFPRFVEAERTHGSLLRAFRARARQHGHGRSVVDTPEPSARGSGEREGARDAGGGGALRAVDSGAMASDGAFRSLPGGLSEMIRALVDSLPASSIRLNTSVRRIVPDGSGRPSSSFRAELSTGETLTAPAIVLAAPAYATARLVRELDEHLAGLCDAISYSSTATVLLAFPRAAVAHPLNGSGFVVPQVEANGILAASWMSSKWPHRAPDDHVLLRAFAGGTRDPKALERTDRELVTLAMNALRPILGIAGEPQLTRIYRWERASAQHDVGHLARMATIERSLANHPGLFVTGSGFRGVGIPDCVADGRATAMRVADWLAIVNSRAGVNAEDAVNRRFNLEPGRLSR
jgi:oxygen-dependent protoporphyrinogen oxidase